MAEVDTSFYKVPQQPSVFDLVSKMGGAADALGKLEVGKAVQQSTDDQGNIDRASVLNLLKQSPVGAMKAIPTADSLERLRQAGFAADQAALDTYQKRLAIVSHLFSGVASKDNPTMSDIYEIAARALDPALDAKKYGITLPVIMNVLKSFRGPDGKPLPPAELKKRALEIQTQAASTAEILSQHSPRGEWINQGGQMTFVPVGTQAAPATGTAVPTTLPPGTIVKGPQGDRYLGTQPPVPGGGAVGPNGQPIEPSSTGGSVPTGTPQPTGPMASRPPGFDEATALAAKEGASMAADLARQADAVPGVKTILDNLEEDLSHFTSGPAADWTRVGKAWVNRNVPLPEGMKFDPRSISSQENFNKQALMMTQAQFQTIGGTGTDTKFDSAFKTSPNELLSEMGNRGIIALLKGNQDAILTKNKEWKKYQREHGVGPEKYTDFTAWFNDHYNPRAFQFKYLKPAERQEVINRMDPDEARRFIMDLDYARRKGWVDYRSPKGK